MVIPNGGTLQPTDAPLGTRELTTLATCREQSNTLGTRMGGGLPLEHGRNCMITFNLFCLGFANILTSLLMGAIFSPRGAG